MLTKELISKVAGKAQMTKKQTEQLMDATTAIIIESLCSGKSVQLQGFGVLETKQRAARTIVHPKTGERSVSPEKTQIVLRPSSNLKDELKNI